MDEVAQIIGTMAILVGVVLSGIYYFTAQEQNAKAVCQKAAMEKNFNAEQIAVICGNRRS